MKLFLCFFQYFVWLYIFDFIDDYKIDCSDAGQGEPVAQRLALIVKCYKEQMEALKQQLAG